MAATDQRTTSGPADPLNPHTKAEDMTAPTILAKLPRKPLIRGRRPDMARKPGHREERVISHKTIVQGMPDCCGEPVVTNSCAFLFAREAAGALGIRHSLRPLFSRREYLGKSRVRGAARRRACVCVVMRREKAEIAFLR